MRALSERQDGVPESPPLAVASWGQGSQYKMTGLEMSGLTTPIQVFKIHLCTTYSPRLAPFTYPWSGSRGRGLGARYAGGGQKR